MDFVSWLPMPPSEGPPVPAFLNWRWPWLKEGEVEAEAASLQVRTGPATPDRSGTVASFVGSISAPGGLRPDWKWHCGFLLGTKSNSYTRDVPNNGGGSVSGSVYTFNVGAWGLKPGTRYYVRARYLANIRARNEVSFVTPGKASLAVTALAKRIIPLSFE